MMAKKTSDHRPPRQREHSRHHAGGLLFAALMLLLSHGWLLLVREVNVAAGALLSYTLQQLLVWGLFLLIDDRLPRRTARFAWAALATLYTSAVLLDGFLMRMTSLPLREILPMLLASQQIIEGLREIGLTPPRVALLVLALLSALLAGGALRLFLDRLLDGVRSPRLSPAWSLVWLAALPLASASEQTLARDEEEYLYRGFRMPNYLQLYEASAKSVVLPLALPVAPAQREQWLAQVGPAKNPRHVLYVLLESFRADLVEPQTCPAIWQLAQQSQNFEMAMAEATYTPLSWSVLLFDEAAHDNLFGRHPRPVEPIGSWLLAVMRKAGFEPHVSVSTNLSYAKTRNRLLGAEANRLDYFQAAPDAGGNPADKNSHDRVAADHLIKFVQTHAWDAAKPQFMLLQLDSTHYTYPFPEEQALYQPYSENLALPKAIENDSEATLLHNRYRNAAHYVDQQVGRVIAALKQAGVYEDMVVVLTSDHGEGMTAGLQGHAAVGEFTRRVPLLLRLPGEPKLSVGHSEQLISHRDILPRLTRYLDIAMPAGAQRGSAETAPAASTAVFTLAPSGRSGQLSTPGYVVDLRLVWKPSSVTVTPVNIEILDPLLAKNGPPSSADWLPLLAAFLKPSPTEPGATLAAR
jgi:hypothetical protein